MDVTLPRLNRAHLTGSHIEESPEYQKFKSHGKSNSIFFTHLKREWRISINENGGVTIWKDIDPMEALRYIRDEILPLCD